ncbi:hypothetical protein [Streptomyces sp. NPDC003023]|uniref:hypothetical protein n=1 Tax=Streptomyces sp. NPDC003023 TaxID=3364675 RepID=UPI0036D1B6DD
MEQDRTSPPREPGGDSVVCAGCGAVAQEVPVTWICSVEDGARHYFCDECARANIRAIEGRLNSDWW